LLGDLFANAALAELAVNPLMLTMLAELHETSGAARLPVRRTELYAEICSVFASRRDRERDLDPPFSEDQSQAVLGALAWRLMCDRKTELARGAALEVIQPVLHEMDRNASANLFLRDSHDRGGLFLKTAPDLHSFAHLSLQEYLAATHAKKHQLEAELLGSLRDQWWRQTLLFYSATGNYRSVIAKCLAEGEVSVDTLVLAVQCLEESGPVDPETEARVATIRDQWIEDGSAERRRTAAQVRLELRLSRMMRHDECYVDSSLITNAEYQLFIDDGHAAGENYQPDHWDGQVFRRGEGSQPVTGVRPGDAEAFCGWLSAAHSGWRFRLPKDGEISMAGHWKRTEAGFDCVSPEAAGAITESQLRARIQADAGRAAAYRRDVYGSRLSPGDGEEALPEALEPLYGDICFNAEFLAKAVRDQDFFGDFNFGKAVYSVMNDEITLEDAWDPDLIRAVADMMADTTEEPSELDLTGPIPRFLDLDQAFHFLLDDSRKPWFEALKAETELDKYAVRMAKKMDRGLRNVWETMMKPRQSPTPPEAAGMLRRYLRLQALIAAGLILGRAGRTQDDSAMSEELDRYWGLYIALAVLEERIAGDARAFEGIAIVKEISDD
jgi:hypothetical protein